VAVGRVVFVAGVLILLFIPYVLWGTGLMTARSQALLRTEFHQAQQRTGSDPVTVRSPPKKAPAGDVQLAPTTSVPSIGSPVGTIDIPKIGLSMVVVEGTDEIRLQQGPGHYPGTPLPGQSGNVAIAGHRTTYLHSFCNLNELITGDPIIITTTQGQFQYGVIGSQVVSPDDVAVVAPTPTPQLTLTTCNPRFSASQRLVVHAALVSSVLVHPTVPPVTSPPRHSHPTKTAATTAAPSRAGQWTTAILWGVGVTPLITLVWVGARRARGGRRAFVLVVGVLAWLVVVFWFFQSITPLLPSMY